jgi:hypothetical protein
LNLNFNKYFIPLFYNIIGTFFKYFLQKLIFYHIDIFPYFVNIFTINLAHISYNVLGIRRFAVAYEGLQSKTSNRKMWLEGGVGASEATDLADCKPGADR